MATTSTREEAWKLLTDYVPSDNLQRHALAVPVKSVLKMWKDKAFAAGVDCSVIERARQCWGWSWLI